MDADRDDDEIEVGVRFMTRTSEGLYYWAAEPETSYQPHTDIVFTLSAPDIVDGKTFRFKAEEFEMIRDACNTNVKFL